MSNNDERAGLMKTRTELAERITQAVALIASLAEDDPEIDAACAQLTWTTREAERIDALLWGPDSNNGDRIELMKID